VGRNQSDVDEESFMSRMQVGWNRHLFRGLCGLWLLCSAGCETVWPRMPGHANAFGASFAPAPASGLLARFSRRHSREQDPRQESAPDNAVASSTTAASVANSSVANSSAPKSGLAKLWRGKAEAESSAVAKHAVATQPTWHAQADFQRVAYVFPPDPRAVPTAPSLPARPVVNPVAQAGHFVPVSPAGKIANPVAQAAHVVPAGPPRAGEGIRQVEYAASDTVRKKNTSGTLKNPTTLPRTTSSSKQSNSGPRPPREQTAWQSFFGLRGARNTTPAPAKAEKTTTRVPDLIPVEPTQSPTPAPTTTVVAPVLVAPGPVVRPAAEDVAEKLAAIRPTFLPRLLTEPVGDGGYLIRPEPPPAVPLPRATETARASEAPKSSRAQTAHVQEEPREPETVAEETASTETAARDAALAEAKESTEPSEATAPSENTEPSEATELAEATEPTAPVLDENVLISLHRAAFAHRQQAVPAPAGLATPRKEPDHAPGLEAVEASPVDEAPVRIAPPKAPSRNEPPKISGNVFSALAARGLLPQGPPATAALDSADPLAESVPAENEGPAAVERVVAEPVVQKATPRIRLEFAARSTTASNSTASTSTSTTSTETPAQAVKAITKKTTEDPLAKLLKRARAAVADLDNYQARLVFQQRTGDELRDPVTLHVRQRISPGAMRLGWEDSPQRGRQWLQVAGEPFVVREPTRVGRIAMTLTAQEAATRAGLPRPLPEWGLPDLLLRLDLGLAAAQTGDGAAKYLGPTEREEFPEPVEEIRIRLPDGRQLEAFFETERGLPVLMLVRDRAGELCEYELYLDIRINVTELDRPEAFTSSGVFGK